MDVDIFRPCFGIDETLFMIYSEVSGEYIANRGGNHEEIKSDPAEEFQPHKCRGDRAVDHSAKQSDTFTFSQLASQAVVHLKDLT